MMADPGDGTPKAGGGPVRHIPVLLRPVLEAVAPEPGKLILDGTFGAGGYTRAILEAGADVVALDRDPKAIADGGSLADEFGNRLTLAHARFSTLADYAPDGGLSGVVLDIGVSSMQIDEAERGFSFMRDGPLDMRMDLSGPSAADAVNLLKTGDLARIFNFLGEERQAGRIARAIVQQRARKPFETTRDLADLVETVHPRRAKDKIHPATRVFQALRIFVNDELGELAQALLAAERSLKPGGRLVVVTFHSLEDRLVKRFLQDRSGKSGGSRHLPQPVERPATFKALGKGIVTAGEDEIAVNARARSARLRAGTRTDAAAETADIAIFGLPKLAALNDLGG